MSKYNLENFQIAHSGIDGGWETSGGQQARSYSVKMSSFGNLNYGNRDADDYTKLSKGFQAKDELQNPEVPAFAMAGDYKENPFIVGGTRHRVWADELRVLTLGARTMEGATLPGKDVSDTKLSLSTPKDGDMTLNWPAEGYKSLGGRTGGPFGYESN